MILKVLGLAICFSAILYRMGGSKHYDTLYRDIGCPLVFLILLSILGFPFNIFRYIIFFGLSWVALSTYWDSIFGYDNFYAHGFGCGLAGLALCSILPLWVILLRLVISTFGMGFWSKKVKTDIPQELGRGVFFIL